jgi:hypothetical protein
LPIYFSESHIYNACFPLAPCTSFMLNTLWVILKLLIIMDLNTGRLQILPTKLTKLNQLNSVAFSPQANYTDRAIAACR